MKRIFIAGPTGVGKTELAIRLAKVCHGEILSMDSMQIYRGMDIGTAKATKEEQSQVPHHLIDICDPGKRFTVSDYQRRAQEVCAEMDRRGNVPLFVGGTGLYLNALVFDYQFTGVDTTRNLRMRLEQKYDADQGKSLYDELNKRDPATASTITAKDRPRLIRALEVYAQTGSPASALRNERQPTGENLVFALSAPRKDLYARINDRVDRMLQEGLVQEVASLLSQGIERHSQAMQAIGYREVVWYERGLISYEEMRSLIQRFSRNYAKRQLTWIRKIPFVHWIEREPGKDPLDAILPIVEHFLSSKSPLESNHAQ